MLINHEENEFLWKNHLPKVEKIVREQSGSESSENDDNDSESEKEKEESVNK